MENFVNNCMRQRVLSNHKIRTIHEEEDQEEWIVYFEDIDHEDEMVETEEEMSHYYDNDSSSRTLHLLSTPQRLIMFVERLPTLIRTNPKKRRIIPQHNEEEEQQKGEEEEDEEDTASSPSNKTKVRYITDTGSKINEVMNEEFSAELKKRGLCVVPLSMLSNFIAS